MKSKAQRKHNASTLCDAEQYEPIIKDCLTEKQAHALPPRHLANGLSLFAELILTHYEGIAEAFTTNNGVEVSLKFLIGGQKDELKLAYKPVAEIKDAAIATVPDPDQVEMEFERSTSAGPAEKPAKAAPVTVDAEIIPAGLPAPMLALPAPERTEEEREAYQRGRDAFVAGPAIGTNPYDALTDPSLHREWLQGWWDAQTPEPGENPFREGYDAGKEGAPADANPYPSDSTDHETWAAGWNNGVETAAAAAADSEDEPEADTASDEEE